MLFSCTALPRRAELVSGMMVGGVLAGGAMSALIISALADPSRLRFEVLLCFRLFDRRKLEHQAIALYSRNGHKPSIAPR